MQPRTALAVAVILLLVAGSIALAKGRGALSPAPVAAELQPTSAAPELPPAERPLPSVTSPPADEFLGVILARTSADIAPRFEGRLQEVHVRLGDHVLAGEVIANLDAPSLGFDLRVAEAALATAGVDEARTKVELAEARERLGRRQSLAAEALASSEDLAAARYQEQLAVTRLEATRAQIAERRAQVERLRKDNADTRIIAPFEGIIAARYVDPGANVRPSTPIVRLISMNDLFVRFAVPEQRARAMAVGREVRVRVGEARLDVKGTVERVAPEVDAASHMVFLEARLGPSDPKAPLLSGEIARVSLAEAP